MRTKLKNPFTTVLKHQTDTESDEKQQKKKAEVSTLKKRKKYHEK